jgi:hypothetical protein
MDIYNVHQNFGLLCGFPGQGKLSFCNTAGPHSEYKEYFLSFGGVIPCSLEKTTDALVEPIASTVLADNPRRNNYTISKNSYF